MLRSIAELAPEATPIESPASNCCAVDRSVWLECRRRCWQAGTEAGEGSSIRSGEMR